MCVWLPVVRPSIGDLARNPGMCPGWESNQRPFISQAGIQSTESHQPGYNTYFYNLKSFSLPPSLNDGKLTSFLSLLLLPGPTKITNDP